MVLQQSRPYISSDVMYHRSRQIVLAMAWLALAPLVTGPWALGKCGCAGPSVRQGVCGCCACCDPLDEDASSMQCRCLGSCPITGKLPLPALRAGRTRAVDTFSDGPDSLPDRDGVLAASPRAPIGQKRLLHFPSWCQGSAAERCTALCRFLL